MSGIDIFIAYKFIKLLSTPWTKWDAYKLGLIDKKGKTIRKAETKIEKKSMPFWKILVRNIKKMLEKLPFGATKLGSFAAALWLIKEEMNISDITLLENEFKQYLNENDYIIETELLTEEGIPTGKYIYQDNMIYLKETPKPIGTCYNKNIYQLKDITGKQVITLTENQLRSI